MRVEFVRMDNEALRFKTFWFKPERSVRYIAGQFTELTIPHDADDRGMKRWFTLSSSPTDKLISITTRIDPIHTSSFKQQLLAMQPGTELSAAEPMGDFVLPKSKKTPIVFIAGGIGVTPMHSMIKWLTDTGEQRDITLYHAAKVHHDLVFGDLFESASINYMPILEFPPKEWKGLKGRLSVEFVSTLSHDTNNALIYLSGPEPMVEHLYKGLKASGIPEHRLVTDYFSGYTEANI